MPTFIYTEARIMPKLAIASVISAASANVLRNTINLRPGDIVRAADPTVGAGEFIFLPTLASVTAGHLVTYRQSASGVFTTAVVPNTAALAQPIAVAMAAGATNNYGWFQMEGTATVKKIAVKINTGVSLYISATTGRVTALAACGKQILGMKSANRASVVSATSTVTVILNRPHMQGQIT